MALTGSKIVTWQNVDLDNPAEMDQLVILLTQDAGERARAAVKDLQDRGILDAQGNRIRTDTPLDMMPDSTADFGG